MALERPPASDRPAPPAAKARLVVFGLFLIPFFVAGLFIFSVGVRKWLAGDFRDGLAMCGFATVFLLFSVGMLTLVRREHRRERERQELQDRYADEPWRCRPDWAQGRVESGGLQPVVLIWVMAAVFIGFSLPLLLAVPKEWAKGNHAIFIGLLFPLAGLALLVWAARATIQWRKYGRSAFEMSAVPGVLGGTLGGAIEIPAKVRPETGFKLRLVCIQRTVSGSGKNRSVRETVLWEDTKTLVKDLCEHDPSRTAIPVHFNPPLDQPPSADGNPAIIWRLEVSADVPGVDYEAKFDVPVFRRRDSRSDSLAEADPTAEYQPASGTYAPPDNTQIVVRAAERGGTELVFPPARNVGVILGLLVFTLIWNVILALLIVKQAGLFFILVWGFFDALVVFFLLSALLHSVRVQADRDGITVRHGFILPMFTRRVAARDLETVRVKPGMQSGTKVFYDLRLVTRAGKEYSAGGSVPDKRHAEWLAAQLRAAVGLGG